VVQFAKITLRNPDNSFHMVNSISSSPAINEVTPQAARQPQPTVQAPTNGVLPQDTVSLKSTGDLSAGDPDHDGK
jgi:hypothetical protein